MSTITYLAWRLDKQQPLARELAAALRRFEARCGCSPTELLAPLGSRLQWPGVEVREARNIPTGQVWLGADLAQILAALAERAA